jgi:hypothetical protein
MDWDKIRQELAAARRAAGFENASTFGKQTGFDPSLAYRIEKGETDPTLETIDRWLILTTKESIGAFLTRCEQPVRSGTVVAGGDRQPPAASPVSVTSSDTGRGDTVASPSPSPEGSHAASIVEGPELLPEAEVAALFTRLGYAIVRAGEAIRTDFEIRQRGEEPPRRRRADIVALRADPPDVRRLDE